MLPHLTENYGNPSSLYSIGQNAHAAIDEARRIVARALGANKENEIYFTSGGSEADNWAIKGAARILAKKGKKHIISTKFEHHAVLHTLNALEKEGFEITLLDVHEDGLVRLDELKSAVREDTGLVTIMFANNEIGTIQPIAEIGAFCREKGIIFHTDAVQAIGNVEINVVDMNIDMLSLSAHKTPLQQDAISKSDVFILYISKIASASCNVPLLSVSICCPLRLSKYTFVMDSKVTLAFSLVVMMLYFL